MRAETNRAAMPVGFFAIALGAVLPNMAGLRPGRLRFRCGSLFYRFVTFWLYACDIVNNGKITKT
ncbi:hypothetical protein ET464_14645 [Paenibacillus protaetiae]|uniref:Uncharacterized protein n=1 Tax=Paenibacillus protaetiae TaxID=2509456 RepID=A0A4P6EWP2_9BACL|nr:hypothetical protein ET464_14645 [Paenibacillus protaetiae]